MGGCLCDVIAMCHGSWDGLRLRTRHGTQADASLGECVVRWLCMVSSSNVFVALPIELHGARKTTALEFWVATNHYLYLWLISLLMRLCHN